MMFRTRIPTKTLLRLPTPPRILLMAPNLVPSTLAPQRPSIIAAVLVTAVHAIKFDGECASRPRWIVDERGTLIFHPGVGDAGFVGVGATDCGFAVVGGEDEPGVCASYEIDGALHDDGYGFCLWWRLRRRCRGWKPDDINTTLRCCVSGLDSRCLLMNFMSFLNSSSSHSIFTGIIVAYRSQKLAS